MQHSRSLTDGSISRELFQFALPIVGANVLQCLNGSVNAIWVGRYLGEAALTAVSNANSVMLLLTGTVFGIAMAVTIQVGQCIGAHDITEAKRVISTGSTFFAAISIAMTLIGMALAKPLLLSMNTPAESLPLAVAYMRVMFLALPSNYMCTFVMSLLRGTGDSKTPFYFLLLSIAISAVLNPVFIFGMGPVRGLGIAGAALATFVAQAVSLTALVVHLYRQGHPLCLRKDEIVIRRVDWSIVYALVRKGVPMGAEVLIGSLSGMFMIVLVNRFGVGTTAAFGASIHLWTYIQMPAIAFGTAVSAMAAQNVGAHKWNRVRCITRIGIIYSVLLTGSIVLLINALDIHAYRFFLPADSPALPIASHINRIVVWSFVLIGISVVLLAVVRATGTVVVPVLIDVLSLLVVRFPLAVVLMDRWQADAIWWSFPISSALAVVLAALYYRFGDWRRARQSDLIPVQSVGVSRTGGC
jgi:putative MATE family efflux protein